MENQPLPYSRPLFAAYDLARLERSYACMQEAADLLPLLYAEGVLTPAQPLPELLPQGLLENREAYQLRKLLYDNLKETVEARHWELIYTIATMVADLLEQELDIEQSLLNPSTASGVYSRLVERVRMGRPFCDAICHQPGHDSTVLRHTMISLYEYQVPVNEKVAYSTLPEVMAAQAALVDAQVTPEPEFSALGGVPLSHYRASLSTLHNTEAFPPSYADEPTQEEVESDVYEDPFLGVVSRADLPYGGTPPVSDALSPSGTTGLPFHFDDEPLRVACAKLDKLVATQATTYAPLKKPKAKAKAGMKPTPKVRKVPKPNPYGVQAESIITL